MNPLYTDDQIFTPVIYDYGFKATFDNETNTLFLCKALQAFIKSDVPIKVVKFDKNTFEGLTQDGRSSIHTVANLRSGKGELFDDQMTFVTLEVDKFTVQEAAIQTDLEKLIYTIKTIHTVTQPTQFPKFWNEEWLK